MGDVGIMGMHVPGMSWREIRESAVLAEEQGYSCLSMGESWGEDAFTSLAQLAAVTSRIRIGTSIVPVFARSPANRDCSRSMKTFVCKTRATARNALSPSKCKNGPECGSNDQVQPPAIPLRLYSS